MKGIINATGMAADAVQNAVKMRFLGVKLQKKSVSQPGLRPDCDYAIPSKTGSRMCPCSSAVSM
nr:MAG TPA: hypothetical protein [Caudoviricetes sp.]